MFTIQPTRYGIPLMLFALLAFGISSPCAAASPDPNEIIEKMKRVFEPPEPRIADVSITIVTDNGARKTWVGRQARKPFKNGQRSLLYLAQPEYLKGTALLIAESRQRENSSAGDAMWIYLPSLDRVRKVSQADTFQRFLNTDFTYADLGFVDRRGRTQLLRTVDDNGKPVYEIEFVPEDSWYYSRIVTQVDPDSLLPIRRNYFDRADRLWKVQTFTRMAMVNDLPVPLYVEMRDVQQGSLTVIEYSKVVYAEDLPDELFDEDRLRELDTLLSQ